uniref:Pre-CP/V2 n=1 Tax=Grapevine geminivirus A TaxID=1906317 RepID=A0A5J6VNZ8_9GEMI|nr:pre-CP/V2 [Grapevine geminivirus A]
MWLVFMDRLYSSFQDKRLHPAEILPHVTQWICEKGTAQQLIDWIHGLQSEKEEIFRTLDACSIGPSEEMEGFVGPRGQEKVDLSLSLSSPTDERPQVKSVSIS